MSKRLQNKVAVVTAATAGIGRAIALMFVKEGAKVIVNGRDEKRGKEILSACRRYGKAELVLGDVSESETWERIKEAALLKFGKIDILVNNAANLFYKAALETSDEEWDRTMRVSLKSAFLGAKACLPFMIKKKSGSIINISSVWALCGGPGGAAYQTGKGGMNALTNSLAIDYGKYNIRANTITPGPIASLQNTDYRKDKKAMKFWNKRLSLKINGKPFGAPEDVAYAAVYLASDEARFVTTANLLIDGGWVYGGWSE